MDVFDELMDILEVSIRKNGADLPLTLGHLRNLLAMAEERVIDREIQNGMD